MIALVIALFVSLITTFLIIPPLRKFLSSVGIVSLDVNKKNRPVLPASGGIFIAVGVLAGILVYTGLQTFIYGNYDISLFLLTSVSSVIIVAFIGVLDDLNVKSKPVLTRDGKNIKVGLIQWVKALLVLPAAIPLMVINVSSTTMSLPFIGDVNFGLLYPLLIIPFGVIVSSNMVNMLGGYNGIEAGMGAVYTLGLGVYALTHGSEAAAVVFLSTFAALLPFLRYNWYPAKLLPGDSLTYLLGVIVAVGIIIGHMQRAGIVMMLPFIFQGTIKFYSKFKLGEFASDIGIVQKDGTIKPRYDKIYSLIHVILRLGRFKEFQVTIIFMVIQALFVILPFILWG